MDYKPLKEFFQKYFVVNDRSAVKNSFSTYVWSKVDSCFCEALYKEFFKGTSCRNQNKNQDIFEDIDFGAQFINF